jgi:hypothetical protein
MTLFSLARHDARFAALHREVYARFTAELAAGLRRIDPAIAPEDAHVRARVVTALLDGMSLQDLGRGPTIGTDRDDTGRTCYDTGPDDDAATRAAVEALVAAVVAGRAPRGDP